MKKLIVFACLLALLATTLCSCTSTCEHCGNSTLVLNQVGDDENGINVCNDCIEKMTLSKLNFNFTCDRCHEDVVGKKNNVTVDGEMKTYCNKCYGG